MRLHRGDVWRKTVAEPIEEVVGRAPLQRRWGRIRSRNKKHRLGCSSGGSHGRQKAGSYLEEDGGQAGSGLQAEINPPALGR